MRELPIFRPPFCGFLFVVGCFVGLCLGYRHGLMCHSGKQGVGMQLGLRLGVKLGMEADIKLGIQQGLKFSIRLAIQLGLSPCLGSSLWFGTRLETIRAIGVIVCWWHTSGGVFYFNIFHLFQKYTDGSDNPCLSFPNELRGQP